MLKKIIFSLFASIIIFSGFIYAVMVEIPDDVGPDAVIDSSSIDTSGAKNSWLSLISTVNEYVWFFVGFVAMIMIIYGAFLIINSDGEAANLKIANRILIYGIIGILISISSYFIVKLIVGLFS